MTGDALSPPLLLPAMDLEGQFNPAIFQPQWLAAIGVITPGEAEDARPPVVTPELALIRTRRLEVQVTHQRAVVRGLGGRSSDELRDVVLTLFETLSHSPISAVDMIHEAQIPPSTARWDTLAGRLANLNEGERLVPGGTFGRLELERTFEDDGATLTLLLEPSMRFEDGVYVRLHREYEVPDPESVGSAERAMQVIRNHWETSVEGLSTIIKSIASIAPSS
jgi:hypothetical protein